jgi:uncharacterized protein YggE
MSFALGSQPLGIARARLLPLVSLACACAVVVGCGGPTRLVLPAKNAIDDETITVVGTGREDLVPDEACIELTLAVRDTTMPAAHEKLAADDAALVEELKHIAGLVVEESAARYEPEYESDGAGHMKLARHKASVQVNVRTHEFTRIPDVLGRASAKSLDRADVVYYSTDAVARKGSVRKRALEAAREKARAMAKTLDVDLGEVVTITEGDAASPSQVGVTAYLDRARADSAPDVPPPPGAIPLSVTVNVVFRLKS